VTGNDDDDDDDDNNNNNNNNNEIRLVTERHAMNIYGRVEARLHALSSATDEKQRSASRPN
jgi:hypothetical protein